MSINGQTTATLILNFQQKQISMFYLIFKILANNLLILYQNAFIGTRKPIYKNQKQGYSKEYIQRSLQDKTRDRI
jgi:hypothetical protein